MTTSKQRRTEKRLAAAAALAQHTGPVMGALADVVHDLAQEVDGLKQFEQDAAYAAKGPGMAKTRRIALERRIKRLDAR